MGRSFQDAISVLRRHGEEANTLVIFMGDNGMAFPHGKGSLYDPGLNVLLIARWPGHIKPGVTRTLIPGEDIAATLMDAGGAAIPKRASSSPRMTLPDGAIAPFRAAGVSYRLGHA